MEIWIGSLLDGAAQARGAVAIIDVFRAFTTAAVVLANGASHIVMVADVAEALRLRENGTGQFCLGEVGGIAPPGFDFGNSPFEVSEVDFAGTAVIQRTSAGTQGIITARQAQCLYAASLVTASATARALRAQDTAERISLVAMGSAGLVRTDEDELCALHLRNRIEGRPGNPAAVRDLILAAGDARRFNDPTRPHLNDKDVALALAIDRYDFAIRVTVENALLVARRA